MSETEPPQSADDGLRPQYFVEAAIFSVWAVAGSLLSSASPAYKALELVGLVMAGWPVTLIILFVLRKKTGPVFAPSRFALAITVIFTTFMLSSETETWASFTSPAVAAAISTVTLLGGILFGLTFMNSHERLAPEGSLRARTQWLEALLFYVLAGIVTARLFDSRPDTVHLDALISSTCAILLLTLEWTRPRAGAAV